MPFSHGKNAVFMLANASAVLTNLSAYLDNVDMSKTADTHESTTFGDGSKEYIPGLKDGSLSLSGKFDPTADALLDGAVGEIRSFEYYPDGNSSGKVKYAGSAIVTEYGTSSPVGDLNTASASIQVTGGVTRSVVA